MRKDKLSDGVHYLSGVYQSEINNAGEIWLSANTIFKYQDKIYSDYPVTAAALSSCAAATVFTLPTKVRKPSLTRYLI